MFHYVGIAHRICIGEKVGIMKKRTIIGTISSVALASSLLTAGAAFATTVYPPEGGTWSYGVQPTATVYSNYYHGSLTHGSTACNGYPACTRSADRPAGTTSYASRVPTLWGNTAYYRIS